MFGPISLVAFVLVTVGALALAVVFGRLAAAGTWSLNPRARSGCGCNVPSPAPVDIIEHGVISNLLSAGVTVIGAGGGGVPVVRTRGQLIRVSAVIDKDSVAALLAMNLTADRLIILSDVSAVMTPDSMGPKVRAGIPSCLFGGTFDSAGSPRVRHSGVHEDTTTAWQEDRAHQCGVTGRRFGCRTRCRSGGRRSLRASELPPALEQGVRRALP
ncbi:hypothetical protein B7R21_09005 [Subtercola boreus]|uniref:Aspartate/glutamate/uridylate kinase domain-containing protein n=1 Tax=Subtercola boreus TaxID=120213 RepID=A0A3E0VSS6_9MICO|nr:hypothetical protein B7R21_09005 [Subtercola boreus]